MAFNTKPFIAAQDAFLGDNRINIDFDDTIHLLDADYTNLYSFLKMYGGKRTVQTPVFHWFEDEYASKTDTVPAGAASGDTNIVVTEAGRFAVNSVVRVKDTGELMLVTGVNMTTNTLTVTRSIGSVAAAAIPANGIIVRIGTAYAEGTDVNEGYTKKTVDKYNYTQIFKTPLEMTNTAIQSSIRGTSNEFMRQLKKKGVEHAFDIQYAFLFGERILSANSDGKPKRYTAGLMSQIATNVQVDADGTLTKTEFEAWLNDMAFAHGSKKDVFVGGIISQAINNWYDVKTTFTSYKDPKLGVVVRQYETHKGTVNIHYLRGLDLIYEQGTAFALDLRDIEIVTLNGRGTTLKGNVQTADEDLRRDFYITEQGIKVVNEKNHAILKGVTAWS